METSPEEVFLLFDKWRSDEKYVLCMSSLFGWGVTLRGRVGALSKEEVSVTVDGTSGLFLRLKEPDTGFTYMEPREVPSEVKEKLPPSVRERSMLGVSLPLRIFPSAFEGPRTIPRREKLFFIEDGS